MRLRHIKGCEEFVANSPCTINEPAAYKGRWQEAFARRQPLHIEIGMGKGQFIRQMAALHPDINYLGIEIYESVMQKAIERLGEKPDNLFFLCMNAEILGDVFAPGEVERIYLNFSDPWPKARHEHRRLTSPRFMAIYDRVLASDGTVEFKTDNEGLFDYSLEAIPQAGWQIIWQTRDLHSLDIDNVETEYEEKFSAKGNPIYKLVARR